MTLEEFVELCVSDPAVRPDVVAHLEARRVEVEALEIPGDTDGARVVWRQLEDGDGDLHRLLISAHDAAYGLVSQPPAG